METARQAQTQLYLSPSEAAQVQRRDQTRRRLLRLKEVREQEKQLAKSKRTQYRTCSRTEWMKSLSTAEEDWMKTKSECLKDLETQLNRLTENFGSAHRLAESLPVEKDLEEAQRKVLDGLEKEAERLKVSEEALSEEKRLAELPVREHLESLQRANSDAKKRAALIIELHRRKILETRQAMKENPVVVDSPETHIRHFDDTYYHVTRSAREADDAPPPACVAAVETSRKRIEEERRKKELESWRNRQADVRFGKAMYGVQMHEGEKLLSAQLSSLHQLDAKRKQELMLEGRDI